MDQQTLLLIFVGISAAALLIQACMLIGIFVVSKATQSKITELLPTVHRLLEKSETTLVETKKYVTDIGKYADDIGVKSNALLDSARVQFAKVEDLVTDATSRARIQMDRAEMVLDDTVSKAQSTLNLVNRGVVAPIREVHGVLSGIRAAIGYLGQRNRTDVERVTADEEMFI